MNKAIVGGVVLAALVAIYLLVGGSSHDQESAHQAASESQSGSSDQAGDSPTRSARGVPAPVRMSGTGARLSAENRETRSYVRNDGTTVRDHRTSSVEDNYERRVTLPRSISPVQPETLAAVRKSLRPAMQDCIAKFAADAPEGAKAQTVLTVSIHDENLRVDKLEVSTEGLAEDQKLKECIEGVMLGHEQVVAGAGDAEAHTMTFPYDL